VSDGIEFTPLELHRIIFRKQFANNILVERVASLTGEVAELMSIVDELQHDLSDARQALADLKSSDDLLAQVESDHAVVHSVSDEQPVPSG
jgi:uncharacterized membrane protein